MAAHNGAYQDPVTGLVITLKHLHGDMYLASSSHGDHTVKYFAAGVVCETINYDVRRQTCPTFANVDADGVFRKGINCPAAWKVASGNENK